MLSSTQENYIYRSAYLYDHDWQFWSEFLGEPFLIDDCFAFFDGEILSICTFSLSDPSYEAHLQDIERILKSAPQFAAATGLRLWGRLRFGRDTKIAQHYRCIEWFDYYESDCDLAIPLGEFSYATNRGARLARNAAQNKRMDARISKLQYLTTEHIAIIKEWIESNRVSRPAASIALSTQGLVKLPHVYVAESHCGDSLLGFSLISLPGQQLAVLLQSFMRVIPGSRIGDSLMVQAIEFSRKQNIARLHLGYSATESVRRFKEKWGATWRGPGYRYVAFSSSPNTTRLFQKGEYLWRDRLVAMLFQTPDHLLQRNSDGECESPFEPHNDVPRLPPSRAHHKVVTRSRAS